ncbi:MAG: hypothetical protein EBZ59_06825 [Planctomycetia bacterium]|nr:hypothetical protein [Planctomycetia bacterium]
MAGVFDGRVIVVGQRSVEALSLESGRSEWPRPPAFEQGSPSGRGILADGRLFVPLDTPEVVEIELVGGRIVDRSPARGGHVPGNLVAYRGEMISQGIDSLDVFHQTDPLEDRIETALRDAPREPAALLWRGQLDLDRGRIASGIDAIRKAHAAEPGRIPRDVVDAAIAFAMRRDFATAAPLWREAVAGDGASDSARGTLRVVVDGFLKSGDLSQAWEAWRSTTPARVAPAGVPAEPVTLVDDSSDPRLALTESRWLQGRLAELLERADPALRASIDAFAEQSLAEAVAATDPATRTAGLEAFIERFGRHPAAMRARESLASEFDRLLDAQAPRSDAARDLAVRRDLLRLSLRGRLDRSGAEGTSPTDLGAPWPVGRVVPQRAAGTPRRDQNQQETLRLSRTMWIPVEGVEHTLVPGLRLGYDMQQPGFVATDGLGRRIGEPFGFDGGGRADGTVPLFNPMAMGTDASAIGTVVVVRAGPVVAAFELAGRPGERNRRLWLLSEKSTAVARTAAVAMGFGRSGRGGRARIPLGMRISEPEEVGLAGAAVQGGAVRATGLPVSVNRSIELHDPATGGILWERHRLPSIGELFGDDQFLCACPVDGRGAVVLSMADGRLLRTCDLPRREQRLLTSGRRIVTVRPLPGQASLPVAGRVRLDLFDPVSLEEKPLCEECHGGGYAEPVGTDRLAVVEPTGRLTVFDLESGRTVFRTTLNEMPDSLNQLRIIPWQDRYLVFCGREETADEQRQLAKVGIIAHLPQGITGREPQQPATGSLWAVDRDSGDLLWPVPATILRHCLHGNQPSELPLLLFVRQIQPTRGGDRPRLSVLCLDKRTGHAAHVDDRITVQPHMLFGCDMAGDPQTHTITLTRAGGEQPDLRLEFTGEPMAPRPPHQAAGRPPVTSDLLTELEYWLQRALTIPLPF